ncbi:MAG: COQ9 family protein [Rhodobacteraceae bacterium]|nr:COQ9 family protein [Paracoccaceae bacterium]
MAEHSETTGRETVITALLDAALPMVAFEGWSNQLLVNAAADAGIDPGIALAACPRRGLDLALAFHRRGDMALKQWLESEDLGALRFRDRVAAAVKFRLESVREHREAVRKSTALFAVPVNAHHGSRALWETSDLIWNCLGDRSDDVNWYSKRTLLSAVLGASVLYWLGDSSEDLEATRLFIDRRIDDVMQIEKVKAKARGHPQFAYLMRGLDGLGRKIRPPSDRGAFPGWVSRG